MGYNINILNVNNASFSNGYDKYRVRKITELCSFPERSDAKPLDKVAQH